MDVERWRRVERVLDAALSREPSDWASVLAEGCEGDEELRQEVTTLLDRVTSADRFLEAPPVAAVDALLDEARERDASAMQGRRVGPYRIVREIGRGGMARVFLAERADGVFAQTVALKLLRASLDTDEDRSRFRIERQILATLNHPNIARLLDGGVTDDGLSYLVMEHVDGETLDRWCAARDATLEQRLTLFTTVAQATQYAHNNLVVHRDLKPSNIYVTADGTVKLLDFGLAKLLEPGMGMESPLTRTGHRWMTPEYAAPEQIRGEPVTTLTDVYQLGVVLYELLARRLPFVAHSRNTHDLETAVLREDPPLPSSTRPALRGDLDAIVMQAIRKEPASRYPSAMALIEDLNRHRARRPVLARRGTVRYRVGRFARRHRAGVAIAVLTVLTLAGMALRERSLRGRAEAEARKATAVEDYLVRVFDVADPFAPPDRRGENMTARAILDRGAARIDSVLTDQPDVQAELRGVIARVYTNLGLFDRAAPMLRLQLAQRRALSGPRDPAVAEVLDQLGVVLTKQDDFAGAEPLLREALAQRRVQLGNADTATAQSMDNLATLLEDRDNYDEAEPLYREALAVRRSLLGDDDPRVAASINQVAHVLWSKGKYDDAVPLYRQAQAIQERRLGPDHPLTAQTIHNLAQVQQMRGEVVEAEALFRRALASKRKSLGDAHPSVTVNLNNLANILRSKGALVEAESLTREALALDRRIFGERHGYVAASLDNLASIMRLKGDFSEAIALYTQALEINRGLHGPEHTAVALNLANLGSTALVAGDFDTAIPLLRQSLAQYRHLLGPKHPNVTTVSINLARALREADQHAEAELLFRGVAGAMDTTKTSERTSYLLARLGLGQILASDGHRDEARPMLEEALAGMRRQVGDTSWRTAEPRLALGRVLAADGDRVRAEPLLRDAVALTEKVSRMQPRLAAMARAELARLRSSPAARAR